MIRSAVEVPVRGVAPACSAPKRPELSESVEEPNVGLATPQSRYVLPSFVERTSYGVKEMNPYNKLFEERIIFLGVQIDDASANDVMAQLLTLEAIDPDRDITMYINSPGGSMTSLMAIYDTMQFIQPEITTCCIGQAASAAAVLLAPGTKGKRIALPNSRILIHQPATEGGYGQSSRHGDPGHEILRMRTAMEIILARHTGKDEEIDPARHRARQVPHRRGGQGVRPHRRGADACSSAGTQQAIERSVGANRTEDSLFPPGPLKGFDGVHRTPQGGTVRYASALTASRDRPVMPDPAETSGPCMTDRRGGPM